MQLTEQLIKVNPNEYKAKRFMIERIEVPELLQGITIIIEVSQHPINFVLVYDSSYNLRAEYRNIEEFQKIVIHQDERKSGVETKPGDIPAGEWIIAFELDAQELTDL